MSPQRVRFIVLMVAIIALPGIVHARGRGYRSGPARTIYGPVYNPVTSPEYRLWANNPAAYEQLMMMRQQQMMMKQQQAYMKEMKREQQVFDKWVKEQKARKDKGLPTDPNYDQYLRMQAASSPAFLPNENTRRNANADPTVAPGGGPRPPAAKKAAARKAATKKSATKKAAKKQADE